MNGTPIPEWAKGLDAAITVCNENAVIIEMNPKAAAQFEKYGGWDMIGKSLYDCHNNKSNAMILELLESGRSNIYTIEKKGRKTLIYQAPWFDNDRVRGLVEISFDFEGELPHFNRDNS